MSRRQVRVTASFFDQLDSQLRPERGPHGEPSSADFVAFALPAIIDRFAEQFDQLPEVVPGVPACRMFLGPDALVRAVAVYGVLVDDDGVELIGFGIHAR